MSAVTETAVVILGVSNVVPWGLIAAGKLRTPAPRRNGNGHHQTTVARPADDSALAGQATGQLYLTNGHLTEDDHDLLAARAYQALEAAHGNATEAAKSLGLARSTFRGRVSRHLVNQGRAS